MYRTIIFICYFCELIRNAVIAHILYNSIPLSLIYGKDYGFSELLGNYVATAGYFVEVNNVLDLSGKMGWFTDVVELQYCTELYARCL